MLSEHDAPRVTVCIPVYNHAAYVRNSIQGVIDQDYRNIELIIIDDGSRDDSVKIVQSMLEQCKARFMRFEFVSRENRGLCATLNQSLEWARGEYFSAIASDDIMLPEKTGVQVDYLQAHPDCVAAFGGVEVIDGSGRVVRALAKDQASYRFDDIFMHRHGLLAPTALIRREAILAVGGYRAGMLLEDWYMWLKLSEHQATLDVLPSVLVQYRRHEENISSRYEVMHEGRMQVLESFRGHKDYPVAAARAFLVTASESLPVSRWVSLGFIRKAVSLDAGLIASKTFINYCLKWLMPRSMLIRLAGW